MHITLDRQVIAQECPGCGESFTVLRGSAHGDGEPLGLYLIALHGHSPAGPLGHLAIAVLDRSAVEPRSYAAAMDAQATSDQFGFSLVDWSESPWNDEAYLGEKLNRRDVLSSPEKALFFRIAERVVEDLPEAQAYFA